MAHTEQMDYVRKIKNLFPTNFNNIKVLEIGSLDINGSVRKFFDGCDYIGVDVGPGPGVDVICEGQNFKADPCSFNTVISCECFEHNPYWVETFKNMHELCASGGLILVTAAYIGRPEHGTKRTTPGNSPLTVQKGWDYYQNICESDFAQNFNLSNMFSEFKFEINEKSCDLYFYGIKW